MTPEDLLMLVLTITGLGALPLYLRVKINLMDRRERSSRPSTKGPADGARGD